MAVTHRAIDSSKNQETRIHAVRGLRVGRSAMTCLVLAQKEREARIRRLVDTNIIGAVITELDGPIVEANDAFLEMPGYSRDDLVAGRLEWTAPTPAEWHAAAQRAIAHTGDRAALVGGAAFGSRSHRAV